MYINFWYPMIRSEDLSMEKPEKVKCLGLNFVVFRDDEGTAHVLSDTCVHRGGSLGGAWSGPESAPRIVNGCVVCPYHGWEFGGDGECKNIPSIGYGTKPPPRAKIDSYPVEEKYGIVFAFLGDLPEEERIPLLNVEEYGQEGWRANSVLVLEVDYYYERSIENGLDPVHNEFVHPTQGSPRVGEDQITIEPDAWGARFMVNFSGYQDADAREKINEIEDETGLRAGTWYIGPNAMVTGIYLPGGYDFVQYFFEAPLSGGRTRIFFVNTRNNNLEAKNDQWIVDTNMKVAAEDQAIVENLWPVQTPDSLTRELLTPGDAVIVKYREDLDDWRNRGWRIDWDALKANEHRAGYCIPSPARRESGNWVLETLPLLPAEEQAATSKRA